MRGNSFVFGLVISVLCLSVASVSAQNLVVNPSFEIGTPGFGWPSSYGEWVGDRSTAVAAQQGIVPVEGSKMLRFVYSGPSSPSGLYVACQVRHIIDVREYLGFIRDGRAAVTLRASFNRVQLDAQTDTQFQVRVYAFTGAPSTYPTQVESGSWIAMQFTDLFSDADLLTWQIAETSLHLPANTEFVAFEVAAFEDIYNDASVAEFDGHYCDVVEFALTDELNSAFQVNAAVVGMGTNVPVPGARVSVLKNGVAIAEGTTDSQGRCNVTGYLSDTDGTFYVRAELAGGRITDADLGPVESGHVYNKTIPIPASIELRGCVKDSVNQRAIKGAQVSIFDGANSLATTATTDPEGRFRCDVQNSGTYYFAASKSGPIGSETNALLYKSNASQPTVVPSGTYVADLGVVSLETNVVVLVHGIKSNAAIWEDNGYPEALRSDSGGRSWAVLDGINLPGQIGSLHGFDRIKKQAEYLKTQIDSIGVQSVNIVAHSQGGLVSRYLNENLAGPGGMVNKLIALATPQHGSPLATSAVAVREWLGETIFGDNPAWRAYSLMRFFDLAESLIPALDDLSPNSGFLKELNQRKSGWLTNDWTGLCIYDNPNAERGLMSTTHYVTIRGEGWGGVLHYFTGPLMGSLFGCGQSDGIVPTESAMLYAGGNNVRNYSAGMLVHHKANAVGIVESTVVRSQVQALLLADPSTWPAAAWVSPRTDVLSADDWSLTGLREMMVPASGVAVDSISIDYCDTLRVAWSWYDGTANLELLTPGGAVVDSAFAAADPSIELTVDTMARHASYSIISPELGQWDLHCESSSTNGEQNVVVVVSSSGAIALTGTVSAAGEGSYADRILKIAIEAANTLPVMGATVDAIWTGPTGTTGQLSLLDNGVLPDREAADGVYTGQLAVEHHAGMTQVAIEASGSAPYEFRRDTMLSFIEGQILDVGIVEQQLSASSSNFLALSPVTLSAAVSNAGAHDAAVVVEFRDGTGSLLASVPGTVPASSAMEFTTVHLPLAAGTFNYRVVVVPIGDYADEDLVDNEATTSIEIGAAVAGTGDDTHDGGADDATLSALGNRGAAILSAHPNPFNPFITLEFAHSSAGHVEVRIFDVRGRLVRHLYSGAQPVGRFHLGWDGIDDTGKRASSGAYFALMRSPAGEDTKKILLIN